MTGKKSLLAQNAAVVSRPHFRQGCTQQMAGEHAPEEVEEPERLDDDPNERPLEEHEQDAADEARRPAQLLFPREEVERLGGPDDERQAREEQDLRGWGAGAGRRVRYRRSAGAGRARRTYVSECEEGAVEEEDDAKEHEEAPEGRQRDADFWRGRDAVSAAHARMARCTYFAHL